MRMLWNSRRNENEGSAFHLTCNFSWPGCVDFNFTWLLMSCVIPLILICSICLVFRRHGFVEKESPPLLKEDFLGDRPVNFSSLDGNVNPVLYKNVVPETCAIPPVLILIVIFVKNDFAIK